MRGGGEGGEGGVSAGPFSKTRWASATTAWTQHLLGGDDAEGATGRTASLALSGYSAFSNSSSKASRVIATSPMVDAHRSLRPSASRCERADALECRLGNATRVPNRAELTKRLPVRASTRPGATRARHTSERRARPAEAASWHRPRDQRDGRRTARARSGARRRARSGIMSEFDGAPLANPANFAYSRRRETRRRLDRPTSARHRRPRPPRSNARAWYP